MNPEVIAEQYESVLRKIRDEADVVGDGPDSYHYIERLNTIWALADKVLPRG